MTRVVCTQHGPRCQRLHVGDTVRVLSAGLGQGLTGIVAATLDADDFAVHFPDGLTLPDGTVADVDVNLVFNEAELEKN